MSAKSTRANGGNNGSTEHPSTERSRSSVDTTVSFSGFCPVMGSSWITWMHPAVYTVNIMILHAMGLNMDSVFSENKLKTLFSSKNPGSGLFPCSLTGLVTEFSSQ
ncbi:hypothetical protein RvY_10369-2 [Ramazzottius varieornatus]|uniref:Uncharacterized protein n=1 Tax=Ramazzottius varieornatus TaxID=947166 RepID=A0A1D1VH10_RAMVA|nr:hypothetical protein RvY_10369-2 [Ramazzottius varieornatus]